MIEQRTSNPQVAGSIPAEGAIGSNEKDRLRKLVVQPVQKSSQIVLVQELRYSDNGLRN